MSSPASTKRFNKAMESCKWTALFIGCTWIHNTLQCTLTEIINWKPDVFTFTSISNAVKLNLCVIKDLAVNECHERVCLHAWEFELGLIGLVCWSATRWRCPVGQFLVCRWISGQCFLHWPPAADLCRWTVCPSFPHGTNTHTHTHAAVHVISKCVCDSRVDSPEVGVCLQMDSLVYDPAVWKRFKCFGSCCIQKEKIPSSRKCRAILHRHPFHSGNCTTLVRVFTNSTGVRREVFRM